LLDATVLVAASGSPTGGSSAAIEILRVSDELAGVFSDWILDETHRTLWRKFGDAARARLADLLANASLTRIDLATMSDLPDAPDFLAAKDHHVVQACLVTGAAICLTLDRRDLLTPQMQNWAAQHGFRLLTPGEFLAWHRLRDVGV
jgi:predicted nucleic acid-binding protein